MLSAYNCLYHGSVANRYVYHLMTMTFVGVYCYLHVRWSSFVHVDLGNKHMFQNQTPTVSLVPHVLYIPLLYSHCMPAWIRFVRFHVIWRVSLILQRNTRRQELPVRVSCRVRCCLFILLFVVLLIFTKHHVFFKPQDSPCPRVVLLSYLSYIRSDVLLRQWWTPISGRLHRQNLGSTQLQWSAM